MDIDQSFGVLSMDSLYAIGLFCLFVLAASVIELAARWKVAVKLGQPGWGVLIPFYGDWVLARPVAGENISIALVACQVACTVLPLIANLTALAVCASIASFVLSVVVRNRLSNHFGHGVGFTVGLVVCPVVFMSILGFGSDRPLPLGPGEEGDDGEDNGSKGIN